MDAVFVAKRSICHSAVGVAAADLDHLLFGELRAAVIYAFRLSVGLVTVAYVVGVRAVAEMLRIDARTNVASVPGHNL